jgi:hypothetical protein
VRTDKWDCFKLKSLCTAKEKITKINTTHEWEKIFAKCSSGEGLIYRTYKELKKLNTKRINNLVNKQVDEVLKGNTNAK